MEMKSQRAISHGMSMFQWCLFEAFTKTTWGNLILHDPPSLCCLWHECPAYHSLQWGEPHLINTVNGWSTATTIHYNKGTHRKTSQQIVPIVCFVYFIQDVQNFEDYFLCSSSWLTSVRLQRSETGRKWGWCIRFKHWRSCKSCILFQTPNVSSASVARCFAAHESVKRKHSIIPFYFFVSDSS